MTQRLMTCLLFIVLGACSQSDGPQSRQLAETTEVAGLFDRMEVALEKRSAEPLAGLEVTAEHLTKVCPRVAREKGERVIATELEHARKLRTRAMRPCRSHDWANAKRISIKEPSRDTSAEMNCGGRADIVHGVTAHYDIGGKHVQLMLTVIRSRGGGPWFITDDASCRVMPGGAPRAWSETREPLLAAVERFAESACACGDRVCVVEAQKTFTAAAQGLGADAHDPPPEDRQAIDAGMDRGKKCGSRFRASAPPAPHAPPAGHAHRPGHAHPRGHARPPGKAHRPGDAHRPGHLGPRGKAHPPGTKHAPGEAHPPAVKHAPGEAHPPAVKHAPGEAHPPAVKHAPGEAHPPAVKHAPGEAPGDAHPPAVKHAPGEAHPPGTKHAPGEAHPPGTKHAPGEAHPPGTKHAPGH